MKRDELGDLSTFMVVAEERSFTRAAAKLGTSQSAVSHTVRRLETRLGLRLLVRTTRNVAPTEAGERLLETLRPAFDDIEHRVAALGDLRDRPAGTIRVTSGEHAARKVLWPVLERLLPAYPDIKVEISVDDSLADLVEGRFDAGIRLGERLGKDMIAVPIGPDLRMVVIASPDYLARHGAPAAPHDLADHACINYRLPTLGGLYAWEFEKDGQATNVRVAGRLIFNSMALVRSAVLAGMGLAVMMHDEVAPLIAEGRLVTVLDDWTPPFSGYHLYYPSRRQPTPAFALLVDALRYRSR
jgi:DNA-binding transcriptional LysR family regulator